MCMAMMYQHTMYWSSNDILAAVGEQRDILLAFEDKMELELFRIAERDSEEI